MDTTIEWLGTAAAAELLGVQSRTLYRFIDEGRLPAYRFGRVIRVMRSDLEDFVRSCRIAPGSLGDGAAHDRDDRDRAITTTSIAPVHT